MAREPYDIFVKEFLQHPAWEEVIEKIDKLIGDLKEQVVTGTWDAFEYNKGRVNGAYEALSVLRGLISHSKA